MSDWMNMLTNRANRITNQSEAKKERRQNIIQGTVDDLLGAIKGYQTQKNFDRQQGEIERAAGARENLALSEFYAGRKDERTRQAERAIDMQRADKAADEAKKAAEQEFFQRTGRMPDETWDFDPRNLDDWSEEAKSTDAYYKWYSQVMANDLADRQENRLSSGSGAGSGSLGDRLNEAYEKAIGQVISQAVGNDPETGLPLDYHIVFADPERKEELLRQFNNALNMFPELYVGEDNTFNRENAVAQFSEMLDKAAKEEDGGQNDGGGGDGGDDTNKTERQGLRDKIGAFLEGQQDEFQKTVWPKIVTGAEAAGEGFQKATDFVEDKVSDVTGNVGDALSKLAGGFTQDEIFKAGLNEDPLIEPRANAQTRDEVSATIRILQLKPFLSTQETNAIADVNTAAALLGKAPELSAEDQAKIGTIVDAISETEEITARVDLLEKLASEMEKLSGGYRL